MLFIFSCHSQEDVSSNAPELTELPAQEGWNSTLTTTSQGKFQAVIKFEHMEKFTKKKVTQFDQGVEIDFYDDSGAHSSKVYAENATLNDRSKNVELGGRVEVHGDNGIILRTEKLLWNEAKGSMSSDEYVTIITAENDSMYGYGFESGQSLENWTISKPWGASPKKLNTEALDKTTESNHGSQN
ncbi:MAG: LPS export ABC transporter periplasmic protein LptC [bacterium]